MLKTLFIFFDNKHNLQMSSDSEEDVKYQKKHENDEDEHFEMTDEFAEGLAEYLFELMDLNHDGKIDIDEWM